jgi:serine/threonine protein kinase
MSDDDDKTRYGGPVAPASSALTSPGAVPPSTVGAIPADDKAPAASAPLPTPNFTAPNALGPGFALREFEIERVIGEGGFSIVYLAIDQQLGRRVAIKEYMPSALALRNGDLTIVPKSERVRETFEAGLRSFVNEARLLAQFDHPSLVKVYRFWEERGTAYMVMPYYEGITLSQWRRQHGQADEAWLRRLVESLLEALGQLHGQRCYHRDIAPDNILLLPGDQPVLLDLGAARRIIGDMTQALTVILKPGYAPVEQYAEVESMKQGAWTDLYAFAAVMYFVVAGRAPPPAVARMVNDDMRRAKDAGAGRYSDQLLDAIDAALAVLPEKRPQNIDAFRALLGGGATQIAPGATTSYLRPTSSPGIPGATTFGTPAPSAAPVASPAPASPAPNTPRAPSAPSRMVTASPPAPPAIAAPAQRKRFIVPVLVALIGVGGVGTWLMRSPPPGPTAPAQAPAPAPAASAPAPASAAPVPPPLPTPQEVLTRLYEARSPSIEVRAAASATTMRIGRDKLRFAVASNISGHVYVLLAGTDASHLYLLFPNARDNNNAITANATMLLPRTNWEVTADGPPGTDRVLVIVSPRPRDFAATGLREDENFGEFSLAALAGAIARGGPTVPAGTAQCSAGAQCDTSFGAALFEVTEVDVPAEPAGAKGGAKKK